MRISEHPFAATYDVFSVSFQRDGSTLAASGGFSTQGRCMLEVLSDAHLFFVYH
jgi:hypothetical protein